MTNAHDQFVSLLESHKGVDIISKYDGLTTDGNVYIVFYIHGIPFHICYSHYTLPKEKKYGSIACEHKAVHGEHTSIHYSESHNASVASMLDVVKKIFNDYDTHEKAHAHFASFLHVDAQMSQLVGLPFLEARSDSSKQQIKVRMDQISDETRVKLIELLLSEKK